ncbi:MAG: helix-turn-helix transcriptional regulator [Alphaproteobacteria bacterium]|nr:helix-turn-helix transcriptional regulator [Alphaproteobacteria bacterium]
MTIIPKTQDKSSSHTNIHAYHIPLSEREKDCLKCLILGMTAKEIARELSLSPRTIESYLENIKNKMCCYSKSQLIAKVIHEFTQIQFNF